MQQQQQQQQWSRSRSRSRRRRRSATELPNEILQNIFSRLPVKTLTRFKSVSKSINSLLHDPHFIKLHLQKSQISKNRVLITTDPPQIIIPPNQQQNDVKIVPSQYPSLITADDIEIIGSCNGLLCFMVYDSFTDESVDYGFVLWNPSTKICRSLPIPSPLFGNYPDIIPIYGFGYDSSTDDYKIIRAVSPCNGIKSTDLEIYSLKENVWRKKRASLPCVLTGDYWRKIEPEFQGIFSRGTGVFTNGVLHWLENRNEIGMRMILSFNLSTEEFEDVVSLPDYGTEDSYLTELRVFETKLSILVKNWKHSEIEIWVMNEYGVKDSWMKTITMPDNPGLEFVDTFVDDWFVPFLYCENGCLMVDMDGREVLLYDPKVKSFSRIDVGDGQRWFLVQEFVESLVSPYDM